VDGQVRLQRAGYVHSTRVYGDSRITPLPSNSCARRQAFAMSARRSSPDHQCCREMPNDSATIPPSILEKVSYGAALLVLFSERRLPRRCVIRLSLDPLKDL
jgi:hypothetical protein